MKLSSLKKFIPYFFVVMLYFKTAGATHILKRLAWGDMNGDGVEDLMIRDDVTLDEGSYSSSRLFVFTKRSARHGIEVLN